MARVIQGRQPQGQGIERFDCGELVAVATLAGWREIFDERLTSLGSGNDVFHRERVRVRVRENLR